MVKIANYNLPNSPVNGACTAIASRSNCTRTTSSSRRKRRYGADVPGVHRIARGDWNLAHPPFTFKNVAFSAGSLRAEGLIGGVVVARDTARSPGTAAGIKLVADPPVIDDNGEDISRIEAYIVDANGTWIPDTSTKTR